MLTAAVSFHAGCYAEYATIKSSLLASIPDNMSFEQAAALPLVSLTAMLFSSAMQNSLIAFVSTFPQLVSHKAV